MSTTPNNPNFREIEVVRMPDGLFAQITVNDDKGRVSFSVGREYDRNGETIRTVFLNRRHLDSLRAVIDELEAKLDRYEDQARAAVRARTTTTAPRARGVR